MVYRLALLCALALAAWSCKPETPWSITCDLYDQHEEAAGREAGACEDLTAPKIVLKEMQKGMHGYYDGGDSIYINSELKDEELVRAVVIHEMVHYIDTKWLGLMVPGPAKGICASEDKAWEIEGVWWTSIGKPEKANDDWWKWYPHCWKFYAPERFTLTLLEYVIIAGISGEEVVVELEKE